MTNPTPPESDDGGSGNRYFLFVFSIPVLVVLGLVAIGVLSSNSTPLPGMGRGGLAVGRPMPTIAAEGWLNGDAVTNADLQGKVVLVEAWATWCGPCRSQAPHMVELYEKYSRRGVVFIGLTSEGAESLKQIRRFLDHFEIEWLNGYGAEETLVKIGANSIPTVWIFGPDGKVVWNIDSEESPEEGLDKALAMLPRSKS